MSAVHVARSTSGSAIDAATDTALPSRARVA